MIKLIINGELETELTGYNRNRVIHPDEINDTTQCDIAFEDVEKFVEFGSTPITSLQIVKDGEIIYNLVNIHARIDVISERLQDEAMLVQLNLVFDN